MNIRQVIKKELERINKKLDWYIQADKESKGIWLNCEGYHNYKSQKYILLKILRSGGRKINE